MATYTGQQKTLLVWAQRYHDLGYKMGLASGKELLHTYEPTVMATGWMGMLYPVAKEQPDDWDNLSIILDGLVCVDLDVPHFDVLQWHPLPPTLKERTPRGWHLYYRLPYAIQLLDPKINWKPHVDLLVSGTGTKATKYGKRQKPFGGHVLCTPTPGYTRVWPDYHPRRDDLPIAPQWIVDVLEA